MTVQIRPSRADDLEYATALLMQAGLPVDDLEVEKLAFTAECDDAIYGLVGVESFGDTALLRSLVVAEPARGKGVGQLLVSALEVGGSEAGVAEMWLLTIDADGFFNRLGYEIRDRADAPESIRTTREFSGLCPGDAILMSKKLGVSDLVFSENQVTDT